MKKCLIFGVLILFVCFLNGQEYNKKLFQFLYILESSKDTTYGYLATNSIKTGFPSSNNPKLTLSKMMQYLNSLRGPEGEKLSSALIGRVSGKGIGTVEKVIIRNSDSTFIRILYLSMYNRDTLHLPSGFTSITYQAAFNELKGIRDSIQLFNSLKTLDLRFERMSLNILGMISKWTPNQLYLSCPVDFGFIYDNPTLNSIEKGYLLGGFIIGRFEYYATGKLDDIASWYSGIQKTIFVYNLIKLKIPTLEISEIENWIKEINSDKLLIDLQDLKKNNIETGNR